MTARVKGKAEVGAIVRVRHHYMGEWTGKVVCKSDTGEYTDEVNNGIEYEVTNSPERINGKWFPLLWDHEIVEVLS